MKVNFYGKELNILIPVYIELDPRTDVLVSGDVPKGQYLKALIKKGLRAQLQMQSFITGQLLIDLDFHPGKPAATSLPAGGVFQKNPARAPVQPYK
ncbi:MAG: hypothetical protein M0033_11185, partial [Nitrospiraceae bacterium]|nr:hypothetical protein [Nitrospiraceae bacterium]